MNSSKLLCNTCKMFVHYFNDVTDEGTKVKFNTVISNFEIKLDDEQICDLSTLS